MDSKLQLHIINLLKVLSMDIPELQWLLYIVEHQALNKPMLQLIESVIQEAYQKTSNELLKDKLQKSFDMMAHIKVQEWTINKSELDQVLQSIL